MSSSTNKGNISTLLFTLACIATAVLVSVLARLMAGDGLKAGKYINPNVSTKVVGGTIYDSNGRILAMDVPVYNVYANPNYSDSDIAIQVLSLHLDMTPDEIASKLEASKATAVEDGSGMAMQTHVLVKTNIDPSSISGLEEALKAQGLEGFVTIVRQYERTYPAAFHSAQLIQSIEEVYGEELFPIPEFNVSTTYGKDLHLSIDLDVQYLLDLVVQQVYELQSPSYVMAGIVDARTAKLLACTAYPFYDLNDMVGIAKGGDTENATSFTGSFSKDGTVLEGIAAVDYATDHKTGEIVRTDDLNSLLGGNSALEEMISSSNGLTSIAVLIPKDDPLFAVYICPVEPKYYTKSTVLDDAVEAILEGLQSQGRLNPSTL